MESSSFLFDATPRERRALGYRWEDDEWRLEPTMAHGAFGAMGGILTSANDYAKWVAYLLSAWPPRDEPGTGPVSRASVRELGQGSIFPRSLLSQRVGHPGQGACPVATNYGMGFIVSQGCDFGVTLSHGGGYPGYGSHILLIPQKGLGLFAFANKTYAGPSGAVWDAAAVLTKADLFKDRALPVSVDLARAYLTVGSIYKDGNITGSKDQLAINFLMDRDAAGWSRDLTTLKKAVGDCDTAAAISPTGMLAGDFKWRCAHGRVTGSVLLAPTKPSTIQQIKLERTLP
jgi:CubicO group peptidase (beta-lactamase class C family)